MKFPYERDWLLYFCKGSWDAYFKMGYDIKMAASRYTVTVPMKLMLILKSCSGCINFIHNYSAIWTEYEENVDRVQQTLQDMHDNETIQTREAKCLGTISSKVSWNERMMLDLSNSCYSWIWCKSGSHLVFSVVTQRFSPQMVGHLWTIFLFTASRNHYLGYLN